MKIVLSEKYLGIETLWIQRGRLLLLFFIFTVFPLVAQGGKEELPPEVKALIGVKLPPVVAGKERARIPNFISKSGEWGSIAYEEGVIAGRWPVFIVERINADKSLEILDIQMLPASLIDWIYIDGDFKNRHEHFKNVRNKFAFSTRCRSDEKDERVIFGLVMQEQGKETCSHYSGHVKRAWMINRESGIIESIPTQELQCFFLTMDDCF